MNKEMNEELLMQKKDLIEILIAMKKSLETESSHDRVWKYSGFCSALKSIPTRDMRGRVIQELLKDLLEENRKNLEKERNRWFPHGRQRSLYELPWYPLYEAKPRIDHLNRTLKRLREELYQIKP